MQGDQLLPAGAIHADSLPGGKQDPRGLPVTALRVANPDAPFAKIS